VYDGDDPRRRRRPLAFADLAPVLDAWLDAARKDSNLTLFGHTAGVVLGCTPTPHDLLQRTSPTCL
jgi:hypothetical protein